MCWEAIFILFGIIMVLAVYCLWMWFWVNCKYEKIGLAMAVLPPLVGLYFAIASDIC
jgi:hypothetical protein